MFVYATNRVFSATAKKGTERRGRNWWPTDIPVKKTLRPDRLKPLELAAGDGKNANLDRLRARARFCRPS